VIVPMSRGIIVAVGVLTFVFVWGEAQLGVALLSAPGAETLPVAALGFQGEFGTNLAGMYAVLAMMTIPVIALYLTFNRAVRRGVSLVGVFR
jgi:raffinose/stachyose/melibiose transport system permease protein